MLRRMIFLAGVLLLVSWLAAAQDTPKAELFGGYSYARLESNGSGVNLNGWNASIAGNLNSWFGMVADFSGQYGSPASVDRDQHSFLFGPRLSYRGNDRVTPFAHALFGASRAHRDSSGSGPERTETNFSMALGGGIDVKANDHVAFRLIQADYLLTRFDEASGQVCIQIVPPPPGCATASTGTQHNARLSFGVLFRFGR